MWRGVSSEGARATRCPAAKLERATRQFRHGERGEEGYTPIHGRPTSNPPRNEQHGVDPQTLRRLSPSERHNLELVLDLLIDLLDGLYRRRQRRLNHLLSREVLLLRSRWGQSGAIAQTVTARPLQSSERRRAVAPRRSRDTLHPRRRCRRVRGGEGGSGARVGRGEADGFCRRGRGGGGRGRAT